MGDTYQKASGGAGSRGVDFQINLIAVFLLNALRYTNNWKLSTENKLAGKFDDVVLELSDGSAILLQAKHKLNRKLTFHQLLSTNSRNEDFSLPKYFFSYLDVKDKFPVKSIIICTNTQAEAKIYEFVKENNVRSGNMLHHGDGATFFTFNDDILTDLMTNAKVYHENNLKEKAVGDSVITEDNAKEFLKHLQLYLDYPSGSDLESATEKLLSGLKSFGNLLRNMTYRDVHRKIKNWFEQPHSEYLTESRAKAMFCEIKSDKYREWLEDYKVFFKNNDKFTDSEKRIFHVVAEGGHLLQLMKVRSTLLQDSKIKILYANCEDGEEVQTEVIKAFVLPLYTHLIIVSPEFSEIQINEICAVLRDVLQSRRYKKVVFVAKRNNEMAQRMNCIASDYEIFAQTLTLADLSDDTQEKLLKKKSVVFQGNDVSLEEIFSERLADDDYKKAVKSEILERLVRGKTITVGVEVVGLEEEVSKYYVDRTFRKVIKEVRRENKRAKRKKGTISEKNIYEVQEKMILISNSAGTGKTTVLANLAIKIKKNHPQLWVVRIELNDCTKILRDSLKNNKKLNLWELSKCKDANKPTNELETILFSLEGRIVLMLDGVDEISPDYTELILDFLVQSQKAANIAKVIVTTRPHMAPLLETQLNVTSFALVPLTELNQVDLLTNYWSHSLKLNGEKQQQCRRYARTLINRVSSWIMTSWYAEKNNPFIAFPLQARMLAEVFLENNGSEEWEGCEEYLKADRVEPNLPERMDIARLYEMFIEHKRDIFVHKGNPSGNATANQALVGQFEEYLAYHRSLALQTVLNEKQRALFSCYRRDAKDQETIALKMGIVQKLGNKLCFVHRTFAEYFVAESLLGELQHRTGDANFERFLIDEVFLSAEFDVVRHFFNNFLRKLARSPPPDFLQSHKSLDSNFDETTTRKLSPPSLFVCRLLSRMFCCSPGEARLLKRRNSYTAMHKLAAGGNTEIIRLVLKCTSLKDVDRRSSSTKTNAHNSLQYLVKRDLINLKDDKGGTPLHQAVIGGHLDTVKFLVGMGADVNTNGKHGGTALHLAFKWNRWDIVEYLLAIGVDINITDTTGRTALHLAVLRGRRNAAEFLVEHGAGVNIRDGRGRTPLHFVDSRAIVDYLIDHNGNIEVKDKRGCTALHLAALRGGRSVVQTLVKRGVDVGGRDRKGRTALHFSVLGIIWNALKFLLEHGVDVNVADKRGLTVLHLATQRGSFSIVEYLVKRGADVNAADRRGRTALDFAAEGYYRDVTDFFTEYCPDMHVVTEEGWPRIVDFLSKRGGDKGRPRFVKKNVFDMLHPKH